MTMLFCIAVSEIKVIHTYITTSGKIFTVDNNYRDTGGDSAEIRWRFGCNSVAIRRRIATESPPNLASLVHKPCAVPHYYRLSMDPNTV